MPPLPVSARPRSPPRVRRLWVVLLLWLAAFAGVGGAAADNGRRHFDVPAGAAVTTIKRAAMQAGLEIVYSATLVEGLRTPAVVGEYRPGEGIERLLAGTGLRLVEDKQTGALSISRAPGAQPKAHPPDSTLPRNRNPKTTQKDTAPMKPRSLFTLLAGWIAAGAAADAQTAPSPLAQSPTQNAQGSDPAREDKPIELSPFVVNSADDAGYRAASTLAGSKLNTNLRDVASSISVVTKDFMKDTGSNNLEDILVYTVGTEVNGLGGNFSNFNSLQGGRKFSEGVLDPVSRTRVRGLAAADQTRNFFNSGIPTDTYNVDRIDINRGANSALFGLGSPAGIINSTLITPRFKDSAEVAVRVDSENSLRASLDLNRVVVPNRVALRVASLYDDQRFRQKPAFVEDKRIFGAVKARVFKETTFDAFFERVDQKANRPRVIPPLDQLTNWYNYGQPVHRGGDPNAVAASDPSLLSTSGNTTSPQITFTDPTSSTPGLVIPRLGTVQALATSIPNFATNFFGGPQLRHLFPTGANGAARAPRGVLGGNPIANFIIDQTIMDPRIFDYNRILIDGPNKYEDFKAHVYNARLEQLLFDRSTGLELAFNKEKRDRSSYSLIRDDRYGLQVDPNVTLVNGDPNPNYGRPLVLSDGSVSASWDETETFRATLFTRHHLGKLLGGRFERVLGLNTFTAVYSRDKTYNRNLFSLPFYSDDDWVPVQTENSPNIRDHGERSMTTIQYLGPRIDQRPLSEANIQGVQARRDFQVLQGPLTAGFFNPETRRFETRSFGIVNINPFPNVASLSAGASGQRSDAVSFVLQSEFLKSRLHTLASWRKDSLDRFNGVFPATPRNGLLQVPYDTPLSSTPIFSANDKTTTYGAMLHLSEFLRKDLQLGTKLSVFYSDAKNFVPASGGVSAVGKRVGNQFGLSRDYGFMVSLLENKLNLRVTWYETKQANTPIDANAFAIGRMFPDVATNLRRPQFTGQEPEWQAYKLPPDNVLAAFGLLDRVETIKGIRVVTGTTSTSPIVDISDAVSEGLEMELTYNPTRNWTMLVNAAQQEASTSNTGPGTREFIAINQPIWDSAAGNIQWEDGTTLRSRALSTVVIPWMRNSLQDGGPLQELRKWRANFATNYRFTEGKLRGANLGGALRWQDRVAIGFPVVRDPVLGLVPQVSRPDWGPDHLDVDLWVGYQRPVYRNKVRWNVQLNVRNILTGGDSVPLRTQGRMAGEPARVAGIRATLPTTYELTNAFSF